MYQLTLNRLSLQWPLLLFVQLVQQLLCNNPASAISLTDDQAYRLEKYAMASPSWKQPLADAYGVVEYTITNQTLTKIKASAAGLRLTPANDLGIVRLQGEQMQVEFTMHVFFKYKDPRDLSKFMTHNASLSVPYKSASFNFQAQLQGGNKILPLFGKNTVSLMQPLRWTHTPWETHLQMREFHFTNGLVNVLMNVKLNEAIFYAASQLTKECPQLFLKADPTAPCS